MKCPQCGHEISQEEVFCGQCGRPIAPQVQPTEAMNPSAPRSGLLRSYNGNTANTPNIPDISTQPSPSPFRTSRTRTLSDPVNNAIAPQDGRPLMPRQQTGFYQDATEAMPLPVPPQSIQQEYSPSYPQQFSRPPVQNGYPANGQNQYTPPQNMPQQFPAGTYPGHNYPPTPQFPTGQGYGMPTKLPAQLQKQPMNLILMITIIGLIVIIIAISSFAATYFITRHARPVSSAPAPIVAATTASTPASVPSPTATMPPSPTPAPDTGFAWCAATVCTPNGFTTEYPLGWTQTLPNGTATFIKFAHPTQTDIYASFKSPGPSSDTATNLVLTDIQQNFATQPGYVAPTGTSTATIGGDNWVYAIVKYQNGAQLERVEVFSVVHQTRAYTIELQAPDAQFDPINQQFFEIMTGRFQFQPTTVTP